MHGALHDPDGLDVGYLGLRAEAGDAAVKEYGGGRLLDVGAELLLPADVLVPAALQDVIDADTAADVQAKIVVEGANLPTGREAQRVLAARGITVVPDFVANAGGVVAAGFAMDARYSAFRPDAEAVFAAVSAKMRENTGGSSPPRTRTARPRTRRPSRSRRSGCGRRWSSRAGGAADLRLDAAGDLGEAAHRVLDERVGVRGAAQHGHVSTRLRRRLSRSIRRPGAGTQPSAGTSAMPRPHPTSPHTTA